MPRSWSWADVEVATPRPALRRPGIAMAGFRQLVSTHWDITMVAHPAVTLLFDLSPSGSTLYRTAAGRGHRAGLGPDDRRGSVVIGLLPGELRANADARVECLQIRLDPSLAAAALGATSLTGAVVPLEDLWGPYAARVEDRLRAAPTWEARFALATGLLARRIEGARAVDREVAHVWRRTRAARGTLRVEALADEVGWSRQRLWSRFRAQLGLTPKQAARLIRFDRAAHLLAAGHSPAAVAGASGYTDQSHLHRDARAFTGLTPSGVATAPWLGIDHVAWPFQ